MRKIGILRRAFDCQGRYSGLKGLFPFLIILWKQRWICNCDLPASLVRLLKYSVHWIHVSGFAFQLLVFCSSWVSPSLRSRVSFHFWRNRPSSVSLLHQAVAKRCLNAAIPVLARPDAISISILHLNLTNSSKSFTFTKWKQIDALHNIPVSPRHECHIIDVIFMLELDMPKLLMIFHLCSCIIAITSKHLSSYPNTNLLLILCVFS